MWNPFRWFYIRVQNTRDGPMDFVKITIHGKAELRTFRSPDDAEQFISSAQKSPWWEGARFDGIYDNKGYRYYLGPTKFGPFYDVGWTRDRKSAKIEIPRNVTE